MPGLTQANERIASDEALHAQFGCELFNLVTRVRKDYPELSQARVEEIVQEGLDVTETFARDALQADLIGMNADDMVNYVRFVSDNMMRSLGYKPMNNIASPFEWMKLIGIQNKANFFERRVTEYNMPTHVSNTHFLIEEDDEEDDRF